MNNISINEQNSMKFNSLSNGLWLYWSSTYYKVLITYKLLIICIIIIKFAYYMHCCHGRGSQSIIHDMTWRKTIIFETFDFLKLVLSFIKYLKSIVSMDSNKNVWVWFCLGSINLGKVQSNLKNLGLQHLKK